MPLTYCEVSYILTWSRKCVITSMEKKSNNKSTKRYFSNKCNISNNGQKIVCSSCALSTENDKRILEQLRRGFKKNYYQTKNHNLNYLIDPTFTKVN